MATPASGAAAEAPAPGQLSSIIGVFVSPSATMDSLAQKPRFALALVVMTVISVLVLGLAHQRGTVEHTMRVQMENNPRMERLPADQRERAIEMAARFASISVLVGSFIGPVLGMVVISAVLLLVTKVMGGTKPNFRQLLAVVTHSWLPHSLLGLIGIPILLAKDPETVDFQNIVPMSNLSFLFSPTEQHRLYMIASSIDIFSFWVIALLTLGVSRLTAQPKGKTLGFVLGLWVIYVCLFKALRG